MELLQEFFLAMVVSVLIAFLLGKILESDGDGDHGRREEKAVVAADSVVGHAKAADAGGGVLVEEECGEVGVVEEIRKETGLDGRGTAEAARGRDLGCLEGEIADEEEEESEEARTGEQKKSGIDEDRLEKNWMEEVPEKADDGGIEISLAGDDVGSAKDGGDEYAICRTLGEEKDVLGELESREIGAELVKEGERSGEVGADKVKDVPLLDDDIVKRVELESAVGGVESVGKGEKVGSSDSEDDDWEGIERSELEKLFGAATAFVNSVYGANALSRLSSDLQMQLYGFHKVATEGPCYESQPMALKVGARAKWHAWQRLGSMNPEVAMEKYIVLLSAYIPGWMEGKLTNDGKQEERGVSPDAEISEPGVPNSPPQEQQIQETQREPEHAGGANKTL